MRVSAFLSDQGVAFETVPHPPAFTAQRRASYLRVPGRQVAKCVLLTGRGGPVLAVLPATHRVDLDAVGRALGGPVRLAGPDEIADVFRDCEWGALAPFGTLYGLTTLLDASVDPDAPLVFEAHRHALAIRMRCRDFERLERPRRLAFGRVQEPNARVRGDAW
jgi:Ala-tRNA(Pro) deacylase